MDAPTPTSTLPRGPARPLALSWLAHGLTLAALWGLIGAVYGSEPSLTEAWIIPASLTLFVLGGVPGLALAALAVHRAVRRSPLTTLLATLVLGVPALLLGAVWLYALAILTAAA